MDPPVRISLKRSKNDDTEEASIAPQLDSPNGLLQDHRVERFYSYVFSSGNYSYHHNGNIDNKKKKIMHAHQSKHLPLLPLDIQGEIITRLPATSTLRLRSVCRDWNIMSHSPSFILANLAHAKEARLIVHYGDDYTQGHQVHLIETIDNNNAIFRLRPFPWNINDITIIGSCNGILCLLEESDDQCAILYLYNPLLGGGYLKLPHHPVMSKEYAFNFGFCFDNLKSEYKVVMLFRDRRYDGVTISIETCSIPMVGEHIGTPQPWKVIKTGVPPNRYTHFLDPLIFMKGKLYGLVNRDTIISFDVASEELASMPLHFVRGYNYSCLKLKELEGRLLLINLTPQRNDGFFEIWGIEDLNNPKSWTKQLSSHDQLKRKLIIPYIFNEDEIFLLPYEGHPTMVQHTPSLIALHSAN